MEVVVLKKLQNTSPHICVLLGCGRTDKINYVVMTLLGPNLSELRKQQPQQRFSLSTTLRVGLQTIAAIHAIHDSGFLHRDIKPSNIAVGASSATKRSCYMLDFGLARQFITHTGEIRPPRPVAGFRGTVRYASINAHQSKDLGRHDDLWSMFYLLVELANGELPWKKIRDKEKAGKFKMSYDHKKLIKHLPTEFFDFLDHLKSLDYYQEPDYVMLSKLLQNATCYLGIKISDPFDWEQDQSIQSLTTISAGSAPAIQTNNEVCNGLDEVGGKEELKTNVSMDDVCLSVKKSDDDGAPHEKEREVLSLGLTPGGQPEGHRESGRLNQLQQRQPVPPSPLLQATHLVQNDSGHADSLDRFFDMKVNESKSHSHSHGTTSRSQPQYGPRDKLSENIQNSPLEKTRKTSGENHRSRSSKSLTSSSDSGKAAASEGDRDKPQFRLPPLGTVKDHLQNKISDKHSPRQSQDSRFRDSSEKQGLTVALTEVQPESSPTPQVGYMDEGPTSTAPPPTAPPTGEPVNQHPRTISRHLVWEAKKTSGGGQEGGVRGPVIVGDTLERGEGRRGRDKGDGEAGLMGGGSQEETPSESVGIQHKLFACGIQSNEEEVKGAELLPLETISPLRASVQYSPGPPPLEFNNARPQEVWGQDPTQPMSLTHVPTYWNEETDQGGKINDPQVFLPRPPDHPPPKNYTLLASRRRRYRRPTKT